MSKSYRKQLTANDTGDTGGHQAGICVPRDDKALLSFFPSLDATDFNPDSWLYCEDETGKLWRMRYVYYNGKLHGRNTRNEYRITHTTKLFRKWGAKPGDFMIFTGSDRTLHYKVRLEKRDEEGITKDNPIPGLIVLRGWSRVY